MAGKAIRGITVEIGGNTTKLDKALAGSEKKSRSLQVELREVTKLLKFDPTNTELLAQKQDILKSAISETGEKLKILKEAQAQVVAQFERGEIGEAQYRAFQREIMQTENSLEDMRKELNTTEDALKKVAKGKKDAEDATHSYKDAVEKAKEELADFKDKAKETFETLKDGAKTMGTALGGAMIATGGYALKLSTDFDKAFNTLVTRTGASADEMDELNEAMERVYANNFGDSIEDVAESMATVKQNTKLSGDELQKATERALLLRDTFEFDVNESTRTAKMLMDQYGMSADEAFNLIAQGAQNGLDKNGDLLDTINEYSVHFNNLGLGAEDMFNMLVNGAENGTFSVDKLGDAVKEFGIRVKDGSDGTADAFAALGLNADETSQKFAKGGEDARAALDEVTKALFAMDDPLAQNQVGVALFGTMWEDLGVEGVKALMGVEGEISKTSTALEDINNQKYDDIGSALEGLGRTIETDVVKPLGEELKPVVEEAIEYVKDNGPQIKDLISQVVESIGDFIGWVVDNGDYVVSIIAAIGTGFLVWNVASMINGVVGAIKAYKLANEGATISQAILNGVMNANPIMLIATLVAMLVAGIVTFIATNDEARAKFVEIWNKIKSTAKSVLDAIVKFFKESWESIKKAWDACVTYFSGLWDKIKNVYSGVKSWFSSTFKSAWEAVKNSFSGWGEFFSGLWTKIKDKFSTIGSNIATAINGSVKAGVNGVIGAVESIINKGIGLINSAITLANKLPGVSIGKLGSLSLPRLAKGGIVDRSTIAEIGENGREAVLPLEKNTGWMKLLARELTAYMRPQPMVGDGALLARLDRIYDRLNRLQVVLDSGELVGGILDPIDEGLGDKYARVERGW